MALGGAGGAKRLVMTGARGGRPTERRAANGMDSNKATRGDHREGGL